MGDLPPDLDRLGHALTHATERAVARRDQVNAPPTAAGRLRRGGVLRVRVDDAHAPRARPTSRTSSALAIEPAGAAMRCDMPRGQRFHYTDACVEQHPQPQAAR